MARFLMFASLLAGSITGIVYNPCFITWFIFLSIISLCLWQKDIIFLLKLCVLTLPFIIYFNCHAYHLHKQVAQPEDNHQKIAGIIFPDDIQIDGDSLKAVAQLDDHQKVKLYWTIPDKYTKNEWENNNKVIHFQANAQLIHIQKATNFNQFDAQKFYLTKSITHQANINEWQTTIVNSSAPLQKMRYQLHEWHSVGIQSAERLPSPLNEYAQALILGTTPQSLYEDNPGVQTLGLIHLFSVSGFHVTFLMSMLMALARKLWFPKEYTIVVLGITLIVYFIFAGEPDVLIRSVIAGELLLIQDLTNKKMKSQSIWALSLLASLLFTPQILLTLGGQLSFALTFCLCFAKQLTFWQSNLLMSLVSFPLIIQQQYTWHILQTFVNFAAIPVFGIVIVPLVMIGYFGQSFSFLSEITNNIIHSFASFVDLCATLPGNIVIGKVPCLLSVVLFVLAIGIFVREKKIKYYSKLLWWAFLVIAMIWTHFPFQGEYATFDIGQGDAALVRERFNKTITLIDTGGQVEFGQQQTWKKSRFNRTRGETIIVHYLHSRGVYRIDNLVLTHRDQDHVGDAKIILNRMKVKQLIIPAGMVNESVFKKEIKPYIRKTKIIEVTNQVKVKNFPFQIVHPFKSGQAKNEDSIALFGRLGGKNIFTAGDLDQTGEQSIANAYPDIHVDILKFGHHGSKSSTNPEVIDKWQPKFGIVSAGRNNRYNHPNKETLVIAQNNQMTVFNTQIHGMISYEYSKFNGQFKVKNSNESKAAATTN
ncbi:DNA internalization-related competence protein ComEC/Rec2 [Leuconostoc litchii]|uniref:DNA internalization-related competence protein ComEC/Rec2 n=2 Tax=Leuconostoc litchii TaxID=1981069 RepID=A0A652NDL5_9LACO|nr:DNA internalization-related competence protein ComEC/Rec2 [Leuconostoc litchii]TYC45985.1 DNA internalization-related competence protein ComEC/Rec2 [Leuconostoc litchii]